VGEPDVEDVVVIVIMPVSKLANVSVKVGRPPDTGSTTTAITKHHIIPINFISIIIARSSS
jgi:hypothetical protein